MLIVLFAINMLVMKWAGIGDTFDYIWYEINKIGFITNLVLILSDIAQGYSSKKHMNGKMNVLASLIISFVVSILCAYIGCSLMILFSLYGSLGRMLTLTPTVFFNNYIMLYAVEVENLPEVMPEIPSNLTHFEIYSVILYYIQRMLLNDDLIFDEEEID